MILPGSVNIAIIAIKACCSLCRTSFLNSQSGLSDQQSMKMNGVIKIILTYNFMNAILETLFLHCEDAENDKEQLFTATEVTIAH